MPVYNGKLYWIYRQGDAACRGMRDTNGKPQIDKTAHLQGCMNLGRKFIWNNTSVEIWEWQGFDDRAGIR